MKKLILYNIIAFIFVFIISEIICYIMAVNFQSQFMSKLEAIKFVLKSYIVKEEYRFYDVPSEEQRPISGKDYKKKPILLFGCSVTYGNKLSDDENFSGVLSRITKRPVYNLAQDGWTISHMYRHLQINKAIEKLDPEYIIYTFIHDQKRRLYFYQGWPHDTGLYLHYTYDKTGNLQANKRVYPFFYRLLTVKYIQYGIEKIKNSNKKATSKLMFDLFSRSVNIIKDRYPHAKLIMLLYWDNDCNEDDLKHIHNLNTWFTEEEYKKLTNPRGGGFEIINMEETANKPYCTSDYKIDNHHPSNKMWEEFVPILVKKYKM